MSATDAYLLASVDTRTKRAGSNKMEILLFPLDTRTTFGINVFKVNEAEDGQVALNKLMNQHFDFVVLD